MKPTRVLVAPMRTRAITTPTSHLSFFSWLHTADSVKEEKVVNGEESTGGATKVGPAGWKVIFLAKSHFRKGARIPDRALLNACVVLDLISPERPVIQRHAKGTDAH